MEFGRIWVLRGGNIWARCPVLEVELLRQGLPSGATDLPHVLMKETLTLQSLAGSDVHFGLVHEGKPDQPIRVIIEYEEEQLGRACLDCARRHCLATLHNQPFDLHTEQQQLRELALEVRLGPSTAAIVRAAQRREIPFFRLNRASLVQLGQGARQRRIWTAETDRTSAIAETVAQDKQLTRMLLRTMGVPVPEGRPVTDAEGAWETAQELGVPVVVKPQCGNHGRGVTTNLSTREQVERAYAAARAEGESVMVERHILGADHRLLVVGDRLVAAALRKPAQVIGDGRSIIAELVALVNKDPRRSDGHGTVLSYIKLDPIALSVLAEQGYTPESIPQAGECVLIRRNANLSTGGTATDVTDRVHPAVAAQAVDAARVVGLDIAGIDVMCADICRPLEEQRGAVLEVNAGPGLRMHLEPSAGSPRPVGEAIVEMLFPEGQTGRIPVVAITGVNGKTTTTRLIAHLLARPDEVVGMACTDGLYIAGRRIDTHDCAGPQSARAILCNPRVTSAVLETARGGILREGLGFDRCDVAVVTNIGRGNHFGLRSVETPEDLARVKRTVVEAVARNGSAVLNAADNLVADMAKYCPGSVIYFINSATLPEWLADHRKHGGRVAFVRDGQVVLAEGEQERVLDSLTQIPLTHYGRVPFQIENVLAAVSAVWSLGMPLEEIRARLRTFTGNLHRVPGRFNVVQVGEATVIIDYAHNPSALEALVEGLEAFPHERRVLVFTAANRRDEDVVAMGKVVGNGFDRVILYQDRGNNDRYDGELNALLRQGMEVGERVRETIETPSEMEAIQTALAEVAPGDLVVLGIESIDAGQAALLARDSACEVAL